MLLDSLKIFLQCLYEKPGNNFHRVDVFYSLKTLYCSICVYIMFVIKQKTPLKS